MHKLIVCLVLCSAACRSGPPAAPATGEILATVNGRAITDSDLRARLRAKSQVTEVAPEHLKNVLDPIIKEELMAQKAIQLGLDRDPDYRARLRDMQASVEAFERAELAKALRAHQTTQDPHISDEEARAYFAKHAAKIRTELHVRQILERRATDIQQAHERLEAGESFETVAAAQFPAELAQGGKKPWDLGWLRWEQMPDAWKESLAEMRPGDVSDVLRGPGRRFWILQLVETREDPTLTFESAGPALITSLKKARLEEMQQEMEKALWDSAEITYAPTVTGVEH